MEKFNSYEWSELYKNIWIVFDPEGWDKNIESFFEKITQEEYERRCSRSILQRKLKHDQTY